MSFLKVGADVDEQIKFFFSRIKNIEGIQKIINLNAEKLLMMIEDFGFEPRLAQFFLSNINVKGK